MLFDEGDTALLKKWIVQRLEDISDADSDVLADYVLALLRHEHGDDEVKQLCDEQLDDFLKDHTRSFVTDLFTALSSRSYLTINSTLSSSVAALPKPSLSPTTTRRHTSRSRSPRRQSEDSYRHRDRRTSPDRGQKRSYYDRDAAGFNSDASPDSHRNGYNSNSRGSKVPRRGGRGGGGNERWTRGGGIDSNVGKPSGRGQGEQGSPTSTNNVPLAFPMMTGAANNVPPIVPGLPAMPWMPPMVNSDDPMSAFFAAQAAAWGAAATAATGVGEAGERKKVVKKVGVRCKDYDEKGFCMKGDMCPYEHGMDHIDAEYDPNNSSLIPSPVSPSPSTSTTLPPSRGRSSRPRNPRPSRGGHGFHHLGGPTGRSELSLTGPSTDRHNPTLVIENIPDEHLSPSSIQSYFSQFGEIKECEMQPHRNLAVLTFETYDEAKKAYDSPAAIFNNRFVKVFWFKGENTDKIHPRKSQNPDEMDLDDATPPQEPELDLEEIKKRQEAAQKAHEERMAKKKAHEEAQAALRARQEELLKAQAEEKRKLMEKIAAKQAAKKSTSSTPGTSTTPASEAPASQQDALNAALKAQLAKLEAEASSLGIDPNAEPSGEDAWDLDGFRGRGRGREGYRGRGYAPRGRGTFVPRGRGTWTSARGAPGMGRGGTVRPTMSLDLRPKRVSVMVAGEDNAWEKEEAEEEFRHYLINNGIELTSRHPDPTVPAEDQAKTQILTFKDRHNAEKFVDLGKNMPGLGMVVMKWVPNTVVLPGQEERETGRVKKEEQDDMEMGDGHGEGHGETRGGDGEGHHGAGEEGDLDLVDVDEDRWLAE